MNGAAQENCQCGLSVTLRDNRQWNTPLIAAGLSPAFFRPPNTSARALNRARTSCRKSVVTKAYVQTSSFVAEPSITFEQSWTVVQIVTDSTIVDNRTGGRLISVPWSDMLASGSVIARNVYSQAAATRALGTMALRPRPSLNCRRRTARLRA